MPKKVLIVEDHDDFRKTLKDFLEKQNFKFTILEATTAEVGQAMAIRERPFLIFMDVRLPGMNGIEAASKIKAVLPETHIIILTMLETDALKEALKTDDVDAYIGKSELYDKLIPTLEKIGVK